MATKLYLFQGITPNKNNDIHYHFDNMVTGMLTKFSGNNFLTVTSDNYKIQNENVLQIKTSGNTSDWELLNNLTYCIECDDSFKSAGIGRFFHITATKLRGGFTECTLKPDYWATFINECQISNRHILKANLDIDSTNGFYDPITRTTGEKEFTEILTNGNRLRCVIAGMETVKPDITSFVTGQTYSQPILYATEPFDIPTLPQLQDYIYTYSNIFDREISGGSNPQIAISEVYIVEAQTILVNPTGTTFHTYTRTKQSATTTLYQVFQGETTHTANILTGGKYSSSDPNSTEYANYKYFVGTFNGGIELANCNNAQPITFHTLAKENKITVTVCDGEREHDITDDFRCSLVADNSTTGALQQITHAFNTVESAYTGIKNLTSAETIDKGAGQLLGLANKIMPTANGRYKTHGNAFINLFNDGRSSYTTKMFAFFKIKSVYDEVENAHINGINYDFYCDHITTLVRNNTILPSVSNTSIEPYIQAELHIDAIPLDAATDIENHFRQGLYLHDEAIYETL